jgi:hypothetical protein
MSRWSRRSFFAGLLGPLAGWLIAKATGPEAHARSTRSITCSPSSQVTVYTYDGSNRLTMVYSYPLNEAPVPTVAAYDCDGIVTTYSYDCREWEHRSLSS